MIRIFSRFCQKGVAFFKTDLNLLLQEDPFQPIASYPDPGGRGEITAIETHHYDRASQLNRICWRHWIRGQDQDQDKITEITQRVYFPQELDSLLLGNGFTIDYKYSDYDLSPFTSNSPRQLIVCKFLPSLAL